MEDDCWVITTAVTTAVQRHPSLRKTVGQIIEKQTLSPQDRQDLLDHLSTHLLEPEVTDFLAVTFSPLLLELIQRAVAKISGKHVSHRQHDRLYVAAGKHLLTGKYGFERSSLVSYLSSPPSQQNQEVEDDPPRKKQKTKTDKVVPNEEIVKATFKLLQYDRKLASAAMDWNTFTYYLSHKSKFVRWYACQALALLHHLGENEKQMFLSKYFTEKEVSELSFRNHLEQATEVTTEDTQTCMTLASQKLPSGRVTIFSQDLSPSVVSICGILLQKIQGSQQSVPPLHKIVTVPSTRCSIQNLALAVVSGSPVLLEGPVGSGKTAYVEHLAHQTGRWNACDLIKVQLGDQTDSKTLVGTYRCTEIPGEFVWQAGPLTQAVQEGRWILLEDLDYAPMDVISVLLPLLESGTLSVPGHGDIITAAPGFQIFATQRLYSHQSGLYRHQSAHSAVLDHCWTKVRVNSLSKDELSQVIITLYPKLASIAEKVLEIFLFLSAGNHERNEVSERSVAMETDAEHDQSTAQSGWKQRGSRMVSTRDLLKWCERISDGLDFTLSLTANKVFLEALDCFTSSLSKPETRLMAAEVIGARLNISKEHARYFCKTYKPAVEVQLTSVKVGRISLQRKPEETAVMKRENSGNFSFTRHSLVLLERIAACISRKEPVLLVGETGTGKTSTVQYLAELVGQRLKVINMNQQSDSTDLLGGYKPVDIRRLVAPVREHFEQIFIKTFSRKKNVQFLGHIQNSFQNHRWQDLLKLMEHSTKAALKKKSSDDSLKENTELAEAWKQLSKKLTQLKMQIKHAEGALAFTFVEGTLVRALHNGDWILLDEINLASAETLECLSSLLEGPSSSLMLMEKGDLQPVIRHPEFRLFACMNPATDIGKKELPLGIRNRFTEFYVDELVDNADLKTLVCDYLKGFSLTATQVENIVKFYTSVRSLAQTKLMDGTGHHPHFSLRTLCRALSYAATNPCGSVSRSLYESFCLSFLTQLDKASCPLVRQLIVKLIVGKTNLKGILGQPIPPPTSGQYVKVEGYWVASGQKEPNKPKDYIITPSVKANLKMLARIVSARRFPVLLQGETSVGKTSLIQYLAQLTGNVCVRVNNHEHTDLQEYVGFYAADESGKLVFKEGVLVDAMRKGFWIILDELNLAPSDVLEALNRLLDDNRELFIPETQETVSAHPGFMLFATQNPPGQYGGRKVLSRAFRNRFVELHFDDIPSKELETILHGRCAIPQSYSQKMVSVMLELQLRRKGSGVFAGKQGFMTLRDLFRWAERYHKSSLGQGSFHDWDQHIADEGYLLLAGKVRRSEEQEVVREVLQQKLKRTVNASNLFDLNKDTSLVTKPILEKVMTTETPKGFHHLVWTSKLRRLAVLVGQALKFGEPVLLVGETGCGKTTICQLFSELAGKKLFSVNCHLHTETSDFLGGLRPVRSHDTEEDNQKLFEWCDGPLVLAMKEGCPFLIDEISLADDSVLERLNSVLEPEQKLLLAERGSGENQEDVEEVTAGDGFHITATMNPGGDYGKKELSPALRNRFTEIWCEQSTSKDDLTSIIEHNIIDGIQLCNQEDCSSGVGMAMMEFLEWFKNNEVGQRCTVSVRDLLSWVNFINVCCNSENNPQRLEVTEAYIHGACLVFLDGLGVGPHAGSSASGASSRQICLEFLHQQVYRMTGQKIDLSTMTSSLAQMKDEAVDWVQTTETMFGIPPFYIPKGPHVDSEVYQYTLSAPTTALNAMRLLRALQLPKAILLEGSPGVGKTSLVTALAKSSGHSIVRINLSEQTDVTDLFGTDLPVEGGEGGQFAWRDGPLLQALKAGHWVVLDELNLASQSVLEGLNACLDHRGEIFVPELGKYFEIQHEKTRIFACQNPLKQGGGRKGLPKSFLNRFTQVHMEPLGYGDLLYIAKTMYPAIPTTILEKMVEFSQKLCTEVLEKHSFGQRGGPWEFNLRDLFRWCDLMVHDQGNSKARWDAGQHVGLIYAERLRLPEDKMCVLELFEKVFGGGSIAYKPSLEFYLTPSFVQVGHSFLTREAEDAESNVGAASQLHLLHHDLQPLESLMKCIQMNWMAILVGPSASGKSCLAKIASSLTGHPLKVLAMNSAMDTTELLGGFEQTDLHRHYEKIKRGTEKATTHLHRICLKDSSDSTATVQAVQSSWLLVCSEETPTDDSNPVKSYKKKLKRLDDHLVVLKEHSQALPQLQTDVDELLTRLRQLSERVSEGDQHVLGGGGQFEWVDGLLVQALQDGDWLLIDNVNFCSPSVLDRLNGLLEPNGVLSINERGIIEGEIPTIIPHPNFRLILAMDPKYGEISRAMRNRGVEIFVTPDSASLDYSHADMRTLLRGMGLPLELTKQLIEVHLRMREEIHDMGSIPSLLLAASLTMEYLRTGRDQASALREACTNVYVTSQLLLSNQRRSSEILEAVLKGAVSDEREPGDVEMMPEEKQPEDVEMRPEEDQHKEEMNQEAGSFSAAPVVDGIHIQLPSVGVMKRDSASAMVQREAAVVEYVCQKLLDPERNEEDITLLTRQLHHGILEVILGATHKDFQLSCDWLANVLSRLPNQLKPSITPALKQICNNIYLSPLYSHFKKELGNDPEVWKHLQNLPFDLYSKCQLVDHLRYSSSSPLFRAVMTEDEKDVKGRMVEKAVETGRRLHLMLWKALIDWNTSADFEKKQQTPWTYSTAFAKGQLTIDDLPHPAFAHLYHFFECLGKLMESWMNKEIPVLTEFSLSQVKDCYRWITLFCQACHQTITGTENFSVGLLALHWSWVQRKALDVLTKSLTGDLSIPVKFEALVNSLDHSLGLPAVAVERIWKSVTEHLQLPTPYKTEEQANLSVRLQKLCKQFEVIPRHNRRYVWNLFRLFEKNPLIGQQLLSCLQKVANLDGDDGVLSEEVSEMERKVLLCLEEERSEEDGEMQEVAEERMDRDSCNQLQSKAMLLPFQELLSLKQSQASLRVVSTILLQKSLKLSTDKEQESVASLHNLLVYSTSHPGMNFIHLTSLWSASQDLCLDNSSWTELCSSFLASLQQSPALISPVKWRESLLLSLRELLTPQTDLKRNPTLLLVPVQTLHSFNLLSPVAPEFSEPPAASGTNQVLLCDPSISRGVPLGCWEDRLSQLQEFSRLMWTNSGWINTREQSYRNTVMKSLLSSVCWLLSSLKSLIPADSEASWEHCMNQLYQLLLIPRSDLASDPPTPNLLQNTMSLILDLLSAGSQNILTNGQGRSSAQTMKSLTDFHSEILKWTKILLKEVLSLLSLVEEVSELLEVTNQASVKKHVQWMISTGCCWVYLGYLQIILLAPRGPVDPAQKRAVKLKCVQDEIADLKAQLEVISKKKELLTGQKCEDGNQIPERVKLISARLEKLIKKEEKLSRRVAFRPTPSQFDRLRSDISHYLESIGSSASLEGFMQSTALASASLMTSEGKRQKKVKKIQALVREMEGWRKSQQQFLTNLEERYPTYKDLWAGLAMGANGMAVGSQFIKHGLETGRHRCSLDWDTKEVSTLETSLIQLTQFPFTSSLMQADAFSDEEFGTLCQNVLSCRHHSDSEKALTEWNKYQVRLLKLSLLHVANHIQMVCVIDDSSRQSLQSILGTFVEWWHRAEEERKKKEEEEASLFKYKTQTHGSDVKPEEEEERDLRKTFPSYEKDFSDIDADPTKDREPIQEETEGDDMEDSDHFISLDMETQNLVQGIHQYLFTSKEIVENSTLQSDIKDTLSQSYHCAAQIFTDTIPWMVSRPDSSLIGSHLAVSKIHQETISGTNRGHHVMSFGKPFDIYHDPSPSEVVKCRPLLVELTKRIDELLKEWPEHPTLQHLVLLISRIESFPVNSPLMKFVTGLELLLEKAQEWESTAAKFVSLQAQLGPITQLVIEWRKTELSCWSSSLDSVAFHHKQGVVKWWFYIYKVIQNMTSDPTLKMADSPLDAGSHDDSGETEELDEDVWLTSLQKFLESSTIGDFQSRLDIILAFYSQLSGDLGEIQEGQAADPKTSAVSILWNLHRYYQQFALGVTEEMSKLRSPLEKELKEFVKISRWNDINFWAMKAAVEKSHKTVHKLSKKFQAILEGPAKVVFTDAKLKGKTSSAEECTEESESFKELWIHDFNKFSKIDHKHDVEGQGVIKTNVDASSVAMTFASTSLMTRLSSLSQKMKKFCKELVSSSLLDEMVITLDDFGSEVIANVKELQALEVTKDAEKEKHKSEAKHINLRKRKALSDLFKYLTSLGLSYRKGLIMSSENTMKEMFSLPKIESKSVSSSVRSVVECSKLSETLKTKLDKSEHYFFLNHARKAALLTALENPSKELGLPNLDRCRGFSEHLSKVTLQQRKQIGLVAAQLGRLCNISSQLFTLQDSFNPAGSVGLPPQMETESWLCRTKQLLDNCLCVVNQYQILLESCPASANEKEREKHPVSPLPEESLSPFERMRKGDDSWLKMMEKFKLIERGLMSLKPSLDNRQETVSKARKAGVTELMFWSDVEVLDKCFNKLKNCCKTMSDILRSFWIEKCQEFGRTCDVLHQLKNDVLDAVEKFEEWRSSDKGQGCQDKGKESSKGSRESYRIEEVEQLLSGLLLAVQNITQQNHGLSQEQPEADSQIIKEEESKQQVQLLKNQLTEKLGTNLDKDIAGLDLTKIVKLASSLLHDVKAAADDTEGQQCQELIQMVLKILPIMLHYQKLSAYYFSQLVSAHKSSCKLLYILLGIFNELAEKGFCLPAEFSDELSGEGATDFQDIEGGGIDDGEGVKDVSDQIEDEEQVQDVHREGEEKDKDNQNQDDIQNEENGIEMSEDFEGKMHDMEPQEANSDEEDEGVDEDELDKQMGDVDKPDADKLDEKMWGDEDDKEKGEEEEGEEKDKKEELGDGDEEEAESQLVAKDDNRGDSSEENRDKKQEKKEEEGDQMEIPEPNELVEPFDESEYNDDVDPSKANDPPPEAVPEDMDLPDDLNLEDQDGEDEEDGEGDEGNEENPFDIETPVQEMDVDEKDDGKEEEDGKEKGEEGEESKEDEKKESDEDETREDEMEGVEEGRTEKTAEEEEKDKTENAEETAEEEEEETKKENYLPDKPHEVEEVPQDAENAGKSAEDTENIQATESMATEEAGKSDSKNSEEEEAMGLSEAQQDRGHEGAANSKTAISTQTSQEPSTAKRKPGHSDSDRSLGQEEQGAKRLKTVDATDREKDGEKEEEKTGEDRNKAESDLYEHLKDSQSHYDVQAVDTATEEQVQEAGITKDTLEEEEEDPVGVGEEEDVPVMEEMETIEEEQVDKKLEGQSYPSGKSEVSEGQKDDADEPSPDVTDVKGANEESVTSQTAANNASTIHTKYSDRGENMIPELVLTDPEEVETVRKEIEKQLTLLHESSSNNQENLKAQKVWHECEAVTSSLARELCEQLRLVLEPTQASKLRGDYRTGKRINMRKVIPYIASGFRKDKIWLRRTKPSKREYQILLAVDDSSSMADNRSRQMAFESMALVSNALTWLEAGQLAVCSFGESVQLIHPFHEQFSDQSGSKILQEFTFSQKKTKIAQLLKYVTSLMALAKMHQAPGGASNVQISQLVLVISDGRGLFLEGMEKVKSAVRTARDANIFLVFLILDNPENKDSILDIKVPFFKADGLPEIHSYMEHFPFPFYILLRDINALPETLSDALRQWFELVTAGNS